MLSVTYVFCYIAKFVKFGIYLVYHQAFHKSRDEIAVGKIKVIVMHLHSVMKIAFCHIEDELLEWK